MKKLMSVLFVFMISGCAPYPTIMANKGKNVLDLKSADPDHYELEVIDPGFELWFETHWNPADDRLEPYYNHWDDQYVAAWNYKAEHAGNSSLFDSVINYDPGIDYGVSIFRELYYYFRYVEIVKKIQIPDYPRQDGII